MHRPLLPALGLSLALLLPAAARPPQPRPKTKSAPGASRPAVKKSAAATDAPRSFRIGAATFTPGGFLDLTSVWRSRNVGSGIGTSFGGVPFANSAAGALSEFDESAQNSRLDLMIAAHPGREDLTAYVEADFLGAAPSNVRVSSHSNTLRMRLYWVDVRRSGWEVLAGQSWSLLTPNRRGLSPLPSNVFFTEDMDTNYQAGLVWARDPQLRVVRHFSRHWTLGISLESPDQYIGSAVVLPGSAYASQFDNGSNASAPSSRPDIIVKLAYDGHWGGHRVHGEIAGLSSGFHAVNPRTLAASAANGTGGELDGNIELFSHFDLVLNSYFSDGGGRYIFGLAPDFTLGPDGQIKPLHSASTVDGVEYQFTPQWLAYGYYGAVRVGQAYTAVPGGYIGYGFPGGSEGANRTIQEATAGLTRTFWNNPSYGTLQLITQYSYLTRALWWTPAASPNAANIHMVYADLRYILP